MVTVTNYFVRKNKEGNPFVSLELTGDLEAVQSTETGRFYLTAKKCSIPSTFPEEIAKSLIGKQLAGRVERVECEAYDYAVESTGEIIQLMHTYSYIPAEKESFHSSGIRTSLVGA